MLVLVLLLVWAAVSLRIQDWMSFNDPGVSVNLAKARAQITLDPQTQNIKAGDKFSVDIILDTASEPVDGVDIYALHYDPTLLSVIDDDSDTSGVQIQPGKIMELNAANLVSPSTGTIKFSQLSQGGTHFLGKGILATIHFKALASGTAYLKFDFSERSTVDTNAAYKGKDQLSKVVDGIYMISPK
ncbi:MAG: hypothetical protein A3C49_01350 [Candidatus Doudnabacteria bacterium RIFCSPHIGHO2_02_FULL_42_25]|nr:MAG: hypothetical protein A3C49_01350 [Candidatus Doudnabacteria bacterium RIFCSPHIGHO2_02_FULL_42_25]OGE98130.1 MAG: hypothetical protein A3G89_01035 [Candidatus Doudnabacteria bacterium RIFCSPLOWO2_12_FULL_42_9]